MRSQAYYWLHLLPFLIIMGLAVAMMIASVALSILPRPRATWLPLLLTGLFGGLVFVSPPFRELAHPLHLGQMSWASLDNAAGILLHEHAYVDAGTASWLPEFLAGYFVFALARLLIGRLR